MAKHTELELLVLGVVAKFGPLTPYAVRRHFATSPTPSFSSSAGTIYPVLERLAAEGLVLARDGARGRQARRTYRISAAGRRAHLAWLFATDEAAPEELFTAPHDPLRRRLYFLGLLPRAEQRRFLDHALSRLEEELARQERYAAGYAPTGPTRYSRLAAEGMLVASRARLEWLRGVRATLFGV